MFLYTFLFAYILVSVGVSKLIWVNAPYGWFLPLGAFAVWTMVSVLALVYTWNAGGLQFKIVLGTCILCMLSNIYPIVFALNVRSEFKAAQDTYTESAISRKEWAQKIFARNTPVTATDMEDFVMTVQGQEDMWNQKDEDSEALYTEWQQLLESKLLDPNLELTTLERTTQPLLHFVLLHYFQTFPRLHELLIQFGADSERKNLGGDTALLAFVRASMYMGSGGEEMMRYMLSCGFDALAKGKDGHTAREMIEGAGGDAEMARESQKLFSGTIALLVEAEKNPLPRGSCKLH